MKTIEQLKSELGHLVRSASNEQVYRDMRGNASPEEVAMVQRVLLTWADALDKLGSPNLRITFLACLTTIETMGPAYCMLAADHLLTKAKEAQQ